MIHATGLRRQRAVTVLATGLLAVGLVRLVSDAPASRATTIEPPSPARASAAQSVDLAQLAKQVAPVVRKPSERPQDAWEYAWANGRGFVPVPPLPVLPVDAAPTLALARLTTLATVELKDVAAAAAHFGIVAPPRMDEPTVAAVLVAARRAAAPLLRAAGVEVGTAVDNADLLLAAGRLGLDIGSVAGTDDVLRVLDEARAVASPVLWASHVDPGSSLDSGDLTAAGQRLGVAVDGAGTSDLGGLRRIAAEQMDRIGRAQVMPGVDRSTWRIRLPGGDAVARVIRWRLDDPRVELSTEAAGPLNGRASIPHFASWLAERATAPGTTRTPHVVVNGGFWMGAGEPDGLLVHDGALLSDPTTRRSWVRGIRGGFGIADNRAVVGRPTWLGQLVAEDVAVELRGVNRHLDLDGDVVAFTPEWGATTGTPAGTVEIILHDVRLGHAAGAETAVSEIRTAGSSAIPAGGMVVAAHGKGAPLLASLRAGQAVRVTAESAGPWSDLDEGLGAGPLLLTGGAPTSLEDWHTEGFGDAHNLTRHPRTAIGFTADGEALLLVVDGRQAGYSIGMTTRETIRLLRAFGAADAVMLDGGGSSHLVVNGQTVNRPCCDPAPRTVSTAIVLWSPGADD